MSEEQATFVLKEGKDGNSFNLSIDKVQVFLKPEDKSEDKEDEKKIEKIEIPKKSRVLSIIFAFFLGRYGIHHLYLGRPTVFLFYLILSRYEFMIYVGIAESCIYMITDRETWMKEHGSEKIKK